MNSKAYIPLLLMGTALLMTTACSEDLASVFSPRDNKIRFTVSADESVDQTTRGMAVPHAVAFEGTQPSRPLYLCTEITQRPAATRGTRVENATGLTSFGVSAIKTSENVTDEQFAAATPDYFYNLEATRNANEVFEIAQDYYWPSSSEKLFFYAYAPYGNNKVQISDQDAGGAQKVSFTVDTNVANQVDLMTANSETTAFRSASGSDAKSAVPLSFRHELTAIRFVIGEQWLAGSIKSVGIYNVHGVGTMTIGADDASKWVWKNKAGADMAATDDFVLTVDKGGLTGTEDEEFLSSTSFYFLMIPQSFDDNDDAYIEVKYQDNSYEYTVTAPLKGQAAWTRNTTVTYAISSHELTKLKIGSIQWPGNTDWKGPKTAFASGDSIGLYVVDTNGTDVVHQNIKCTYNGSTWTVHHPNNSYVYALPGRQYFFYYPYTPTPDSTYPVEGQGTTDTDPEDFFSHLISGWTPAALQDDAGGIVFKKQDLQVGKATFSSTVASTINATMAHQMNLAIITLGQKDIDELGYERTFYWLDSKYKWLHSVSSKKVINSNYEITASATFGGTNRPWHNTSNSKYYFVFKPVASLDNDGTVIQAMQSDGVSSDWSLTFKSTTVGLGVESTAQSTRTQIDTERNVDTDAASAYVLAVGDIFYSNGAISHSLITTASNSNYGTPVGLVFGLNADMSTADKTAYGHGYVFSLRDANSAGAAHKWSTLDNNDVSGIANTSWSATTDMSVTEGVIKNINGAGQNGRSNTAAVGVSSDSYPAFKAVGTYRTNHPVASSTAPVNSDWYLPSIAEWWLACKKLGNMNDGKRSNDTSWKDSNNNLWGVYYNDGTANNTRDTMNSLFSTKVGSGNYDPIQGGSTLGEGMSAASYVVYWSSSEWSSAGYAFYVTFDSGGSLVFNRYSSKSNAFRVRPVLAF